jgi:hypothetical protein
MQPTPIQVERSLHALRQPAPDPAAGGPAPTGPDRSADRSAEGPADVPADVLATLWSAPAVRPERLAEARGRLAGGPPPSAQALADRIVGRLVCDRLR